MSQIQKISNLRYEIVSTIQNKRKKLGFLMFILSTPPFHWGQGTSKAPVCGRRVWGDGEWLLLFPFYIQVFVKKVTINAHELTHRAVGYLR